MQEILRRRTYTKKGHGQILKQNHLGQLVSAAVGGYNQMSGTLYPEPAEQLACTFL